MRLTKQTAAQKLTAFLHHEISLAQLVDWAETALLDGETETECARPRAQQSWMAYKPRVIPRC